MNFRELVNSLIKENLIFEVYVPENVKNQNSEIVSLISDSQKVEKNIIFACVKGGHFDGHTYALKAFEMGASAILAEKKLEVPLPQIICENTRSFMGFVASSLYGYPCRKLQMVAITGTNGKTTSSFILKSLLEDAGKKTGLLGTVFYNDGVRNVDANHTTPEGSDLQYWLSRMVDNGCVTCVMETSSHAIEQGRISGVQYDRCGFTNLTVDHLDYHGTMENYFIAKKKLLNYTKSGWKLSVNIDDPYGERLWKEFDKKNIITYSMEDRNADFYAELINYSIEGTLVNIKTPDSNTFLKCMLPLLGTYNVMNVLQAISIAWSLGVKDDILFRSIKKMGQVPGRLERYFVKDKGTYIIDFAHTPDALEKTLTMLKSICKGRLFVVFGAGGDRDNSKRPMMGEVATRIADFAMITSDNPRSEDPNTIISEIEKGSIKNGNNYDLVADRKDAIYRCLGMLRGNDILLVAGKGAEQRQILKDKTIEFRDKDVLDEWCKENNAEVQR
ncbi:MAG: UDP-N-acetylmuramoyl-L-alanyl-D-glutamate--2,6-diaminopimelate ligase [Synergistaceae bacterium]